VFLAQLFRLARSDRNEALGAFDRKVNHYKRKKRVRVQKFESWGGKRRVRDRVRDSDGGAM